MSLVQPRKPSSWNLLLQCFGITRDTTANSAPASQLVASTSKQLEQDITAPDHLASCSRTPSSTAIAPVHAGSRRSSRTSTKHSRAEVAVKSPLPPQHNASQPSLSTKTEPADAQPAHNLSRRRQSWPASLSAVKVHDEVTPPREGSNAAKARRTSVLPGSLQLIQAVNAMARSRSTVVDRADAVYSAWRPAHLAAPSLGSHHQHSASDLGNLLSMSGLNSMLSTLNNTPTMTPQLSSTMRSSSSAAPSAGNQNLGSSACSVLSFSPVDLNPVPAADTVQSFGSNSKRAGSTGRVKEFSLQNLPQLPSAEASLPSRGKPGHAAQLSSSWPSFPTEVKERPHIEQQLQSQQPAPSLTSEPRAELQPQPAKPTDLFIALPHDDVLLPFAQPALVPPSQRIRTQRSGFSSCDNLSAGDSLDPFRFTDSITPSWPRLSYSGGTLQRTWSPSATMVLAATGVRLSQQALATEGHATGFIDSALSSSTQPHTGMVSMETVAELTSSLAELDILSASREVVVSGKVAEGAHGVVHTGLWHGSPVAIKFMVADGLDTLSLHFTEMMLCKTLSHPNIVQTYSCQVSEVTCSTLEMAQELCERASRRLAPLPHPSVYSSLGQSPTTSPTSPAGKSVLLRTTSARTPLLTPPTGRCSLPTSYSWTTLDADMYTGPNSDPGCVGSISAQGAAATGLAQVIKALQMQEGQQLVQIVMEECDRGALHGAITKGLFKAGPRWTAQQALQALVRTAREIALGMAYLHANNILHGDLKPANILLRSQRTDLRGFTAKISDFGLSRVLSAGRQSLSDGDIRGTVAYLAPEVLEGRWIKASDVHSFGVVLWQMATGEKPYNGMIQIQIMVAVTSGEEELLVWPAEQHPALAELGRACLAHDAECRPTFPQIVAWLQQLERELATVGQYNPLHPKGAPVRL